MRSVIFEKFGNPAEVLTLGDRPMPEPGPGQIRVKLGMSPIHNHDLSIIRGTYGYKPTLPAVPGTEAMGMVDKLGEGVANLMLGQRVTAGGVSGAWADYFVVEAWRALPLPDAISDEAGCQLVAMPLSADVARRSRRQIRRLDHPEHGQRRRRQDFGAAGAGPWCQRRQSGAP